MASLRRSGAGSQNSAHCRWPTGLGTEQNQDTPHGTLSRKSTTRWASRDRAARVTRLLRAVRCSSGGPATVGDGFVLLDPLLRRPVAIFPWNFCGRDAIQFKGAAPLYKAAPASLPPYPYKARCCLSMSTNRYTAPRCLQRDAQRYRGPALTRSTGSTILS